jgi:hypothetical protein
MFEANRQLNVPKGPFALLTASQAAEVQDLRGCSYSWDEIVAYAPMWGLNARAVLAEQQRIEEALNEQAPTT